MIRQVLSNENQYIRLTASLRQKKHREETGLFVLEGTRLVQEAVDSAWSIEFCVVSEENVGGIRIQELIDSISDRSCPVMAVPASLFGKISDTDNPQGILAVVRQSRVRLSELSVLPGSNLWLILDAIQDPGNLGTIIRTADAAGVAGVLLSDGCADLYAGKTTRATMGSIFHIPVVKATVSECLSFCKNNQLPLYAAAADAAVSYTDLDLTAPCALIFGNEGSGVSEDYRNQVAGNIKIPIVGRAESLNVASAAAVILFEAARQRALALNC